MTLHATALLACITALAALAHSLPYDDEPLHPLANDCIRAIRNLDFLQAQVLYDEVKKNGHLDASAFHLAAAMKEAYNSDQLGTQEKDQLERLKDSLPTSVRNALFAESICIYSLDRDQYLFAPSFDFINNFEERRVFLWRDGGIVPGSNWTLNATLTPTDFKIVNMYGEYLFADDSHSFTNRRNIYTCIPEWSSGLPTNIWRLKSVGNDVIIQNTWWAGGGAIKEYLYAAVNLYSFDSRRGTVFCWDQDWGNDPAHMWRFEDC